MNKFVFDIINCSIGGFHTGIRYEVLKEYNEGCPTRGTRPKFGPMTNLFEIIALGI